jgi:hypothetical protein
MSYDPDCETLAEHFLQDDPVEPIAEAGRAHDLRVRELAQYIQDAVEDWSDANPATPEPDDFESKLPYGDPDADAEATSLTEAEGKD